MDYKIIVLDLDGTLTNRDKVITPRTKEALMKAQEAGKIVVLASGRPTAGVEPLANGGQPAVLRGEGLGAAEDDAVDDDVGRDADLIRNDLAQHGDDDVRADEDQRDGQAHAEAVEQGRRDGHGRAHAQQLAHDGVIGQEPLAELFFKIHFCTSPA